LADQRITQLTPLSKAGAAANDAVPIADISASETKRITLKDLVAAGIDLVDAGEIDLAKLDQTSATKLGAGAISDGVLTAAKMAADAATAVAVTAPSTGNHRGRGWLHSGTGNLQVWDGAAFQQVVMPTAGIGDLQVTTGKLADGAVTTAKVTPLGSAAYAAGSVNTAALADLNVTSGKLADGAVLEAKLGAGAVATAKIAAGAVTYDRIQNLSATDRLLGRSSAGAGPVEEVPLTAAGRALIAGVDTAAQRSTLGLGTLAVASGTWTNGSTFSGTSSGTNTGDQTITLTGDVTGTGTGTFAATIADGAITELKYAALSIPTGAVRDDAITAAKLADQSAAVVSNASPSGSGAFIGQQWLNTSTGVEFTWTGTEWLQHAAPSIPEANIPGLDASKIISGEFGTLRLADDAVTGLKLANYSVSKLGNAIPVADFIGQLYFNPLDKAFFMWDGNVWQPIGISAGAVKFAGTYDASLNKVASTTTEGAALGLTVGSALPAASATNSGYYLVVSESGTGTSPAPTVALAPPDILLSTGTQWVEIDVSAGYTAQSANNISFTAVGEITATNVQLAIEEVSTECRNAGNLTSGTLATARGGTGLASYTKGDLVAASGSTTLAKLAVGTNGQVLVADSSTATGLAWSTNITGNAGSVTNGVYTTGTQTIGGAKTFSNAMVSDGTFTANGTVFSSGIRTNTTTGVSANVFLNTANDQVQRVTSSRKYKIEIETATVEESRQILAATRPVSYLPNPENTSDDPTIRVWGLIAEEVAEYAPEMVMWGVGGQAEGVSYDRFGVHLINAANDHEARIAALEAALLASIG
jgi:hypothetical protein